jgi:repressor LexA
MDQELRIYAVMEAIENLSRQRGYPPTVREVGTVVGVSSPSTVHEVIKVLKRRGWAISDERIPRSLRLTATGMECIASE